jgi:hypothetical protein
MIGIKLAAFNNLLVGTRKISVHHKSVVQHTIYLDANDLCQGRRAPCCPLNLVSEPYFGTITVVLSSLFIDSYSAQRLNPQAQRFTASREVMGSV